MANPFYGISHFPNKSKSASLTCSSSTAVGDIEEDCRLNPSKFIAYWYFQLGVDETQTVDSMIRSLIRQLSRAPLKESVTNLWDTNGFNNSLPDSKSLLNVLEDVISNTPGEVYLLFDALDECPDNVKIKERRVLLSLLTGLLERHKNKIHILATSRPERDIEKRLGKFPKINLEVFLADDVRKFVTTSVTEGDLSESNPEVQKAIIDTLLSLRERYVVFFPFLSFFPIQI